MKKIKSWVLSVSANGDIIIWNAAKLEAINFYKMKEVFSKFKGKIVDFSTSRDYLICS